MDGAGSTFDCRYAPGTQRHGLLLLVLRHFIGSWLYFLLGCCSACGSTRRPGFFGLVICRTARAWMVRTACRYPGFPGCTVLDDVRCQRCWSSRGREIRSNLLSPGDDSTETHRLRWTGSGIRPLRANKRNIQFRQTNHPLHPIPLLYSCIFTIFFASALAFDLSHQESLVGRLIRGRSDSWSEGKESLRRTSSLAPFD